MKFKNFIEVIHELDADYFLIGDKDNEETIEIAIETILNRTDNIAHKENVIVVIKEIESWYLAGLSEYLTSKFNITINLSNTEVFSKEDFYDIRPANLSIFWFMSIILEKYDLIKAFGRNNSLNNYHSIISSISD